MRFSGRILNRLYSLKYRKGVKVKIGINAMVLTARDLGVGIWIRGLIRALARFDRENQYIVYHRPGVEPLAPEAPANFRFIKAGTIKNSRLTRIFWEQAVLPLHLVKEELDVLHCPAYVAPFRAQVPVLLTLHDLFVFSHPQYCRFLNRLHYRFAMPVSIQHATRIHCTSHWTRQSLFSSFPKNSEKARVIPPGVDDIFQAPDPADAEAYRIEKGLPENPFLFVGNIEPKKNISGLLRAFALLRHQHGSDRKLVMVGAHRGWGVDFKEEIERLHLGDEVITTGYVQRSELPLLYGMAFALVLPSAIEGFGIPPLEAMACGTPVVTSGMGGLSESVGGAGIIVQDRRPASLADSLHRIEERERLREKYSTVGKQRAERFRWDKIVSQFPPLYRETARVGAQKKS